MSRSSFPPLSRESLVPLIAALLQAERRIAMLERRLSDARWLGPTEEPNDTDKEKAKRRVAESVGALAAAADLDSLDDAYLRERRAAAVGGQSTSRMATAQTRASHRTS